MDHTTQTRYLNALMRFSAEQEALSPVYIDLHRPDRHAQERSILHRS